MRKSSRTACFAAAVGALTAAAAVPAAGAATPCAATTARGKKVSFANQVACWINRDRRSQHLKPYKKNKTLAKVARKHSKVINSTNLFTHTVGGSTQARIQRSGYLRGAKTPGYGETIAWVASAGHARSVLDMWLSDQIHRDILHDANLRDLGIGISKGSPFPGNDSGYVVTADFGRR
jgi:uncharacterized protein YkwD